MGERKRILLVDDDRQVLFVLEASLQRIAVPCEVITARSGTEAYRLLRADAFDLLITDVRLPGIDGVALTALVRGWAEQLPVVWITAHGCARIRDDAARLSVHCCLEKPVEVSVFRQVVRQAMAAPFGPAPDG